MSEAKVISICNHKGGVGKTVTASCLGTALGNHGKKVLLIDFDPQGNLTKGLGYRNKTLYHYSVKDVILNELNEVNVPSKEYVVPITDGVDLIPANINLAGLDIQLSTIMSRETILKRALTQFRAHYDYILIDTNPALNLFTINTLTASDSLIIPVQAEPYATDGLEDLMHTIHSAKKQLNPSLSIEGVLITMTDARTKLSKHISNEVREIFEGKVRVFQTEVPRCVKTAEASLHNKSLMVYAPNSESARAYQSLAKEVITDGKQITRSADARLIK